MMKASELVAKCVDIAKNYKTLYVYGCFGAPLTDKNKPRYGKNSAYAYNKQSARLNKINSASADTFGFDCVCLIKGVLWGWSGDLNHVYGGAKYLANNVPDIGANSIIKVCSNISTDFSNIIPGELVWMDGHVGIYIGDGLAVECTPSWKDGVQITACNCTKSGYNRRNWTKHGKLPYVEYDTKEKPVLTTVELPVLKKGIEDESVKTLQRLLKALSYKGSSGLTPTVDGNFGSNTEYALRNYQKDKGLDVDGICGKNTWEKILRG